MKILYAIQGTGNGHISRAREIIPILKTKGDVDILISGIQSDVDLPFHVKYKYKGLSFIFGKNGGIDLLETYKKSSLKNLYKEIKSLPIEKYDLIINDFEPVSAWAAKINKKICIGLSHQSAVINKKSPKPGYKDPAAKAILKYYAPVSCSYGFHFKKYDKNIYTPVIREQIRKEKPKKNNHYTVYLPAYGDDKLIKILSKVKNANWHIFSKHNKKAVTIENIKIEPINNENFISSMVNSKGVLCGAGFETPAEALYLRKKLLVIPMKGQYEQQCNAAALKEIGVPVIKKLKKKHLPKIQGWVDNGEEVDVYFKNETEQIIDYILKIHKPKNLKHIIPIANTTTSLKKLKDKSFGEIIANLSA